MPMITAPDLLIQWPVTRGLLLCRKYIPLISAFDFVLVTNDFKYVFFIFVY